MFSSMATMFDADAIAMDCSCDSVTELAHALNCAMHNDPAARARYREIWGHDWTPIPAIGGFDYFSDV